MSNYYKKFYGKLKICILGAYYPKKSKGRLIQLRDCLQKNGFMDAHLVEDFPLPSGTKPLIKSPAVGNIINSQFTMSHSDALIFIFSLSDKSTGHKQEFQYFQDELHKSLNDKTICFVEKGAMNKMGSLMTGYLEDSPWTYCFNNFEEVCEYARKQFVTMFLK